MILEIQQLSKHYGKIRAVNELSIHVPAGSTFGLLGPNGSGKSTTLGMILNVVTPTAGSYRWFAGKSQRPLRKVGAILEKPCFYPYLTGKQNLQVAAKIKDVDSGRVEEVLEWVDLKERGDDKFKAYSLGMKQRLSIASALLADPEVLILDEPTNGLDPMGIAEVRGIIQRIASGGKTIVLASHLLDEVQKVCSDFAVLKKGHKVFQGSVAEALESTRVKVDADDHSKLRAALQDYPDLANIEETEGGLMLIGKDQMDTSNLNQWLFERGISLCHLSHQKNNLEEKFLEILNEDDANTTG